MQALYLVQGLGLLGLVFGRHFAQHFRHGERAVLRGEVVGIDVRNGCHALGLCAGKNILGRETGDSYRKLEYEENKEYYNDMKQDVAAALLGTFGMSEEELSELMGMERDSEKVDELVRRIFEREGWEYEED